MRITSKAIEYGLQPLLLTAVLAAWLTTEEPAIIPLAVISIQLILGFLEYRYPARPDWLQPAREKLSLIAIAVFVYVVGITIAVIYDNLFRTSLGNLRASLGVDFWPGTWPMVLQILLAFLLSELIWYWFHRAEHRWPIVWRLSGHGAHHSFKNLGAINFGANHPFEMLIIVIPSALVELLFGAGMAAFGAAVLSTTQVCIAHANLKLNTRVIGWLFTTNRYHIHHHSMVMEESNTNYGCAAIVWDRLFGTFRDAPTEETGTGPTEPGLWAKIIMPFREATGTQIAPG